MYPINIYASMVSNLTDARYFAAQGVEYIGFDLDRNISLEAISSIINWVEGPLFVGETSLSEITLEKRKELSDIGLKSLLVSSFINQSEISPTDIIRFHFDQIDEIKEPCILRFDNKFEDLTANDLILIKSKIHDKKCFLELDINPKDLQKMVSALAPYGIVIKGGDEERVGVKSFDYIEEIYDALENMQ